MGKKSSAVNAILLFKIGKIHSKINYAGTEHILWRYIVHSEKLTSLALDMILYTKFGIKVKSSPKVETNMKTSPYRSDV